MPDLISVIIPTYNRSALLRQSLASVAAQVLTPAEVIVVDDGSTDDTEAAVAADHPRFAERGIDLIFHRQPNGGPAKARNTGLGLARHARVAFLDSDDLWHPDFLATLDALLDRHPSAGLAFGGMQIIDADGNPFGQRPTGLEGDAPEGLLEKPFPRLLDRMPMGTPCVMVRRCVLDDVGLFDTTYRLGEDWDLWYRIARRYDFAYTNRPLTLCREHPNNTPKWDAFAWSEIVRLDLKQLAEFPEGIDPAAQERLARRIARQSLLFQEQLLREGKAANDSAAVLDRVLEQGLAPSGMRFRIGSKLRHGPRWVGKAYAGAVRAAGALARVRKARRGEKD